MFPEVKSDLLLVLAPASYRCDNNASLARLYRFPTVANVSNIIFYWQYLLTQPLFERLPISKHIKLRASGGLSTIDE